MTVFEALERGPGNIASTVADSLMAMLNDPQFGAQFTDDRASDRLRVHLEALRGVCRAAGVKRFKPIAHALVPLLPKLAVVGPMYGSAGRPDPLLDTIKLFRDLGRAVIPYVPESAAEGIFRACVALVEGYAAYRSARVAKVDAF
jgi:hypothetical protein